MRRNQLLNRRALLLFVCLSVLTSLLAQTLPATPAAPQQGSGDNSRAAGASPTPSSSPPTGGASSMPRRPSPRDLSQYDRGGPFAVGAEASATAREAALAQARDFLLARWRNRRRAQMVLRVARPDGGMADSTFYVEPDESGGWCVVLVSDGGTEVFRVVEEVELSDEGTPLGDEAGGARPNRPAARGLRLKQSAEVNSGLVL